MWLCTLWLTVRSHLDASARRPPRASVRPRRLAASRTGWCACRTPGVACMRGTRLVVCLPRCRLTVSDSTNTKIWERTKYDDFFDGNKFIKSWLDPSTRDVTSLIQMPSWERYSRASPYSNERYQVITGTAKVREDLHSFIAMILYSWVSKKKRKLDLFSLSYSKLNMRNRWKIKHKKKISVVIHVIWSNLKRHFHIWFDVCIFFVYLCQWIEF